VTASFLASLFQSGYPLWTDANKHLLKAVIAQSNIVTFNTSAATISAASTTYTDITGGSFSFTKQYSESTTDVLIIVGLSARVDTASRQLTVGVNDGVTDRDCASLFYNTATEHLSMLGGVTITSLRAQAYTFKFRMKNSGTGTMTMDGNDTLSAVAWEVCK